MREIKKSSKALLDLEANNSTTSSSMESRLLVCNNDGLPKSQAREPHDTPIQKPTISSIPKSQVLGKVKDFLGVISDANERLQLDAKDNSKNCDIEVLTGNESKYIEMDLMLGVADLHTPKAVAAAESAIAGYQPIISLAGSSTGESEDSSDDSESSDNDDDESSDNDTSDDNDGDLQSLRKSKRSKPAGNVGLREALVETKSKERPKIVEFS